MKNKIAVPITINFSNIDSPTRSHVRKANGYCIRGAFVYAVEVASGAGDQIGDINSLDPTARDLYLYGPRWRGKEDNKSREEPGNASY